MGRRVHGFSKFFTRLRNNGKKKEAALLQHYLSPNQIKPNYLSSNHQNRNRLWRFF